MTHIQSTTKNLRKHPSQLIGKCLSLSLLATCSLPAQAGDDQAAFFRHLQGLCTQSFEGEMTFPTEGNDSFAGKRLVAHIKECGEHEIRIPFAVGDDHSRTWVIRYQDNQLSLKHDHRHHDGTPDDVSNYGGVSLNPGKTLSQSFPADTFTQKLIPAAATNIWHISFDPDLNEMTYHLERHGKPRFTAVLSLATDE